MLLEDSFEKDLSSEMLSGQHFFRSVGKAEIRPVYRIAHLIAPCPSNKKNFNVKLNHFANASVIANTN